MLNDMEAVYKIRLAFHSSASEILSASTKRFFILGRVGVTSHIFQSPTVSSHSFSISTHINYVTNRTAIRFGKSRML